MNEKICPTCKKELAADVETCPSCGTDMRSVAEIPVEPATSAENQQPNPEQKKPDSQPQVQSQSQVSTNNSDENNQTTPHDQETYSEDKRFWEIMGIACGIGIFITGLFNINSIGSERFGVENYTESYQIFVACAKGIYGLYVVIGIALVLYYSHKICENK